MHHPALCGEPPMTFRLRLKLLILLFLGILLSSFGVAGYLLVRSTQQPSVQSIATNVPDSELLATAERLLGKQQTEQALILYRRVLTANPTSLEAQLGLARAEFAAGREDTAAQEYERAVQLAPSNTTALLQLARVY